MSVLAINRQYCFWWYSHVFQKRPACFEKCPIRRGNARYGTVAHPFLKELWWEEVARRLCACVRITGSVFSQTIAPLSSVYLVASLPNFPTLLHIPSLISSREANDAKHLQYSTHSFRFGIQSMLFYRARVRHHLSFLTLKRPLFSACRRTQRRLTTSLSVWETTSNCRRSEVLATSCLTRRASK